jgi:hypothetical protein
VRDDVATIPAAGYVNIPVKLHDSLKQGGVNYFIATVDMADGRTGAVSNVLKLALKNLPPGSSDAAMASLMAEHANLSLAPQAASTRSEATTAWSAKTSEMSVQPATRPAYRPEPAWWDGRGDANGDDASKSAIAGGDCGEVDAAALDLAFDSGGF